MGFTAQRYYSSYHFPNTIGRSYTTSKISQSITPLIDCCKCFEELYSTNQTPSLKFTTFVLTSLYTDDIIKHG